MRTAAPTSRPTDLPHAILEQAAEWYAVIRCGRANEQETSRWQAWLAASADHRSAWQQVEQISRSFAPLQDTRDPHQIVGNLVAAETRIRQRRRALLGISVLAGTGMLTWAAWRQALLPETMLAWAADYRTATGEQREVTLADGSRIWLNTASAFNLAYDDTTRRIVLVSGEILIQTAKDSAQRPFIVSSPQGHMRALGTRFNVRMDNDETRIAVYEGAVEVRTQTGNQPTVIEAGWQTHFTKDQIAQPVAASETLSAWTRGILVAEDIPLHEVIKELRRYHTGYIGLHDDLAELKVYGNLPLHDTNRALAMLTTALPVQIRETLPWWISVEPRK